MRITYKGDYALKTILYLACAYGRGPLTIHKIAERQDMPIKFLEQILLDLKRGGYVESRRGKVGGYLLAKHPAQIKLGEVIRFINGPIEPIACVDRKYKGCQDISECIFRDLWKELTQATAKIVDNITFADLMKKMKKNSTALVYQI